MMPYTRDGMITPGLNKTSCIQHLDSFGSELEAAVLRMLLARSGDRAAFAMASEEFEITPIPSSPPPPPSSPSSSSHCAGSNDPRRYLQ